MQNDVEKYIRRIKNPVKKEYAKQYYLYRIGKLSEKPIEPPACEGYVMACQAVRMNINLMIKPIIVSDYQNTVYHIEV